MRVVGFTGRSISIASKPDGTPRKLMDSSRLTAMGGCRERLSKQGLALAYRRICAARARMRGTAPGASQAPLSRERQTRERRVLASSDSSMACNAARVSGACPRCGHALSTRTCTASCSLSRLFLVSASRLLERKTSSRRSRISGAMSPPPTMLSTPFLLRPRRRPSRPITRRSRRPHRGRQTHRARPATKWCSVCSSRRSFSWRLWGSFARSHC